MFCELENSQRVSRFRHVQRTSECFQILRECALIPHVHLVASRWYPRNCDDALAIGESVVPSFECDYHRTHLAVDVAKDIANSGAIENHRAGAPRLVQSQVKPLAFEKREDIVKKRVAIWEFHRRSDLNHEHVR